MEDRILIETPEHVHVSYELAGMGSRALACLVDTLLQVAGTLVIVLGLAWLATLVHLPSLSSLVAGITAAALSALAMVGYYVVCEMAMNGQTPGKRMAGLRVVRDDGTPITFLESAVRNILRLVDMLPGFYSIGLFAIFFSRQSKRLGDMAAGTVVVKERLYEAPAETVADLTNGQPLPPDLAPELAARLRNVVHLLSESDCAAATRFLERRHELEPQVREPLAGRVAAPLLQRLPGLDLREFPDAETFLAAVISLRHQRLA